MNEPSASVRIRLHAMLRDIVGTAEIEIERPTVPCTTAEAFQVLVDRHPELGSWTGLIAFAIDERIIGPDADIPADTTVMDVLPPVSGG